MLKLPHISQCEELRRTIGKNSVCVRQDDNVPRWVVGVGLTAGGSSDWTSFLFLLSPPAVTGRGQETARVCWCVHACLTQKNPFAQLSLNLKVF